MRVERILLTGASGFIGTSLVRRLKQDRISTISLHRGSSAQRTEASELWDPYAATPVSRPEGLEGITAAVHLSGANLAGRRWTPAYKSEISASRVTPTYALAKLLAGLRLKPEVLLCASATGIYGNRGDEELSEVSPPGSGFLPGLCVAWEEASRPAQDAGIRVVHLRFGVVLSPQGGALERMLPIFRAGLGGRLGTGRQWISWIALPDVIRVIEFVLQTKSISGPVNLVAPNPVTNQEFTRSLAGALRRPAVLPVPAFAVRLAFGEMAEATILQSERVVPARLSAAGFHFEYPRLDAALPAILLP
ncbi:MAG: TIGR01777 family oxidoreductase [Acidobacteriaceae bacterium]